MMFFLLGCHLLLILCLFPVSGQSLSNGQEEGADDDASTNLQVEGFPCLRLFHRSGSIGCRSPTRARLAGELRTVTSASEWDALQTTYNADVSTYVVVLDVDYLATLSPEGLDAILTHPSLGGLLLFSASSSNDLQEDNTRPPPRVSLASQTPQAGAQSPDAGLNPFRNAANDEAEAAVAWHPSGLDLDTRSFAYPIVSLSPSSSSTPRWIALGRANGARAMSAFGPVWRLSVSHYFGKPEATSLSCTAFEDVTATPRPMCDPIGGQSAWGHLGPITNDTTYILILTAMDARGLAAASSPGANAALSQIVTLLALAEVLGQMDVSDWKHTLLFGAFQGEAFGFVGSRAFVADVTAKDNACEVTVMSPDSFTPFGAHFCTSPVQPSLVHTSLDLSNVQFALALDQVGRTMGDSTNTSTFFLHPNPNGMSDSQTILNNVLLNTSSASSDNAQVACAISERSGDLPPGPLLSFLNPDGQGNPGLPSVVLSGYDTAFLNTSGYHAITDDMITAQETARLSRNIVAAATLATQALLALVLPDNTSTSPSTPATLPSFTINTTLVNDALACLTNNWRCDLMDRFSAPWSATNRVYTSSISSTRDARDNTDIPSRSDPPSPPVTPSVYTSVYQTRQPMIRQGDTSRRYTNNFTTAFKFDSDTLLLQPNDYEMFVKSALASLLTAFSAVDALNPRAFGDVVGQPCQISQDCGSPALNLECVAPGRCAPRVAYFHNALDPGWTVGMLPRMFRPKPEARFDTAPLWTEPVFEDLTTRVYADPQRAVGHLAMGVGVVVTAGSLGLAYLWKTVLTKQKLL